MHRAEKMLEKASSYVVSTMGEDGFPLNVTLLQILERSGYVTLFFYLDENTQPVQNMKKNPRGSVSCFVDHPDRIETLNLNGTFTIEPEWKVHIFKDRVENQNPKLDHTEAVVIVFETLHFKIETVNRLV